MNILTPLLLGIVCAVVPDLALAQFYNGPGIVGGITAAEAVGGIAGNDIRTVVLNILLALLLFMGLAAVVVIVIAGIWLVLSLGDESAMDRAKKIILYTIAGLILIALASALVMFLITATGGTSIFGEVPNLGAAGGTDIRATVTAILKSILNFMALIAVVVIVLAGIYMVVSLGNETAIERAKRMILYVVIGLIVILLARAIVGLVSSIVV
ncbi:hypothetical protein H6770_05270 [Candidatus Peribacteria bacterium]|nr:hypothetical protein [Candidatus Peribacteria bacterium]